MTATCLKFNYISHGIITDHSSSLNDILFQRYFSNPQILFLKNPVTLQVSGIAVLESLLYLGM